MTAPHGAGLLDAAVATGDPKLIRLVEKVRGLLADIRAGLDVVEKNKAAKERVARLEAELAEAKAELNRGRPPKRPASSPVGRRRLPEDVRAAIVERFKAGERPTHLATSLGVGTATVYRCLREAGSQLRGHGS